MQQRREFLHWGLRIGSAGLFGGWFSACSTVSPVNRALPSGPTAASAPSASAALASETATHGSALGPSSDPAASAGQPAPGSAPGSAAADATPTEGRDDTLAPPPDLFDAELLDADFWLRPRTIHLTRPVTGESVSVLYWKDGRMMPGVYDHLCHLLRDVQAKKTAPIDPKLIETLWACQAFCGRYGMNRPIEILSGYRTVRTNRRLVEKGLPAARKSLHIDGKAADMRIVGLSTEVLGGLVHSFARGGVGFYYRQSDTGGWIHTDTGVNRIWHG